MAAYLGLVAMAEKRRTGKGQYIDLAIYETLLTLIGPNVINYDQLGIVQQRSGSRLSFTAPRNTYRTRDERWVTIGGSAQSAFTSICKTLGIPEIIEDPRFLDNRLRIKNVEALDQAIQSAVQQFDLDDLLAQAAKNSSTMSPVNDVEQIFADPHIQARQNITQLFDSELQSNVRMQGVVGKLSESPGHIRHPGPRLGADNHAVLVEQLGYTLTQLAHEGINTNHTLNDPEGTDAIS
jgi:crotonobetainyl-CoA:carnitine CoA-transferase CaiB-like acyl-CoA transferase